MRPSPAPKVGVRRPLTVVSSPSYTWSCEKINLSMVLVITGQLVSSYDEEFRRLYARSALPPLLTAKRSSEFLRDPGLLQSPKSSQLSLHQAHVRSRGAQAARKAQEDRFTGPPLMARGLSIQERLHHSHYSDMGNLVRGHSYGEDLSRLHSLSRLRMGPRELGTPAVPEMTNLRGVSEMLLPNRPSQQQLKHWTRYGADQNLIPFNSESSLHRWKMDAYLNGFDTLPDCDAVSPLASPFSSRTGLNEVQAQLIHSRSRDIKSRMEEIRQKRLSLQEYSNFRQNQDLTGRFKLRADTSLVDLESADRQLELSSRGDMETQREGVLTDDRRATSYYDVKTVSDAKVGYSWNEPLLRTTSAGNLDLKPKDFQQRFPQPGGLGAQVTKPLKSLMEIPEEKEGSNPLVNIEMDLPAGPQQVGPSLEAAGRAGLRPASNEGLEPAEALEGHQEKGQTQYGEPGLQRKNSLRMKVYSLLSSDEKKQSRKEDKAFQRKTSSKPKHTSGLQPMKADHSPVYSTDPSPKKAQSQGVSKTLNPSAGPSDLEKHRHFQRLSTQRSSKKKTFPPAEPDAGARGAPENDEGVAYQRQKVYSRFEYLLTTESLPKGSALDPRYTLYQGPNNSDKKLGKFMQRVGNLIGKNK